MYLLLNNIISILIAIFQESLSHPLKDAPEKDGEIKETFLGDNLVICHKRLTQAEAIAHCEGRSEEPGRLVVLPTKEDAEALADQIYSVSEKFREDQSVSEERKFDLGLSRRYWIGLTDVVEENNWIWLRDGSMLAYDEFWANGQPDHVQPHGLDKTEHCVSLWNPNFSVKDENDQPNKHSFNDENCSRQYYFICETYAPSALPQSSTVNPGYFGDGGMVIDDTREAKPIGLPVVTGQMGQGNVTEDVNPKILSGEVDDDSSEPIQGLSYEELSHEEMFDMKRGEGNAESSGSSEDA